MLTIDQKNLNLHSFEYRNQLIIACQYVLNKLGPAEIAIVLGSGLGGFSEKLQNTKELSYHDIPFLPQPSVKGHSGKIIYGDIVSEDGKIKKKILCFSGRIHPYEGYPMYKLLFCVRLSKFCGCHSIILTNSAGGCILNQRPGSVVIVTDYIRSVSYRILNHSAYDGMFGLRHPKTDELIDKEYVKILGETAKKVNFPHYFGNYWFATGPTYETAAEIQHVIANGGSAVGMSTVPEILGAVNIGLRTAVLSLCTNVAAGLSDEVLNHAVVVKNAELAAKTFSVFVAESLLALPTPKNYDISKITTPKCFYDMNKIIWDVELFPRKNLATYDSLYKDINYIFSFVEALLNFKLEIDEEKKEDQENKLHYMSFNNRYGPIPVWFLHSPFIFDVNKYLSCPISFPLKSLKGFHETSSNAAIRESVLIFGLFESNLIILVTNINLDGLNYDECNYIINLIYGIIGHKNIFFCNLLTAFNACKIYKDNIEENKDDIYVEEAQWSIIKDIVDFDGGAPRYPSPLLPFDESNIENTIVNFACGEFDIKSKALEGFLEFLNTVNAKKTQCLGYGYWAGPSFPTQAEIKMTHRANCSLVGMTNPFVPLIARQLGFDGYNIACIATNKDIDIISSDEIWTYTKDISQFITELSSYLIIHFQSKHLSFSPLSIQAHNKINFKNNIVTKEKLKILKDFKQPLSIPQYQVLYDVEKEWQSVDVASKWLKKEWNFDKKPIINSLFSSLCNVFDEYENKKALLTIDLGKLPYWNEQYCGGYPYSHYYSTDNNNIFKWTLQIYKNSKSDDKHEYYYIIISPQFGNSKYIKELGQYYTYLPLFWNLRFIVRVLWKVGIKNIVFLSHLFSTNNEKFKLSTNTITSLCNYVECSRWNTLTGPNDERMGPRFVPLTNPFELEESFLKLTKNKIDIPSILTVHVPNLSTISKSAKSFHSSLGQQSLVPGLIPCIQIAQHVSIKKLCLGVIDYDAGKPLSNIKKFADLLSLIELLFIEQEQEHEQQQKEEKNH